MNRQFDDLAAEIARLIAARGETVGLAETSTGGRIGSALAVQPGAATWLAGSIVAYAIDLQYRYLGVDRALVAASGAVSDAVSRALAEGARARFGATWGLAETGIAGPQTGRRSSKPAGLVHAAVAGPGGVWSREIRTGHDRRMANKEAFAETVLALFLETLRSAPCNSTPANRV